MTPYHPIIIQDGSMCHHIVPSSLHLDDYGSIWTLTGSRRVIIHQYVSNSPLSTMTFSVQHPIRHLRH